jgi:hypothetical protein
LVLLFGNGSSFTLGLDLIGIGHLVKILKLILAQAKIKFGQLLNIRVQSNFVLGLLLHVV